MTLNAINSFVRFFANRYLPKGVFILVIALPLVLKSFDQGNTHRDSLTSAIKSRLNDYVNHHQRSLLL